MTTESNPSQPDARAEALVAAYERAGYRRIAPPILIQGRGVYISTVLIQRLVIPIETELGTLHVSVALNESPNGGAEM